MSIRENKAAAARAGGHWLHLDRRAAVMKGRTRNVWLAVCVCGWESIPQRVDHLAVEAGCQHSSSFQEAFQWDRDDGGSIA